LPLTLRSILCQTFTDWELILIDDGSTDGSVDVMRSVADDRVRVLVDGRNLTLAPRLNEISRLAVAPLIARMDADDVMHPRRLQEQVDYMASHPEVDVVGSGVYSINDDYELVGKRGGSFLPSSEFAVGLRGLFVHPTVLGRTRWFLDNPYDESVYARRCEDAELWFRTFARSAFGLVSTPLLFYREDSGSAIKKLRTSNRGRIRIMFRGDGEVRRRRLSLRLALLAIICVKMAFYELCWAVGARGYLVNKRNQPLTEREAEEAREVLERVRHCRVPGLI
jgi:glycosyltransferase involved in cell wall biosynthesis